jgi:hypothetical protein
LLLIFLIAAPKILCFGEVGVRAFLLGCNKQLTHLNVANNGLSEEREEELEELIASNKKSKTQSPFFAKGASTSAATLLSEEAEKAKKESSPKNLKNKF